MPPSVYCSGSTRRRAILLPGRKTSPAGSCARGRCWRSSWSRMRGTWSCWVSGALGVLCDSCIWLGPDVTHPPCPCADTGNTVLSQAKDELQGQAALFKESKQKLGTLKRQATGDRCVLLPVTLKSLSSSMLPPSLHLGGCCGEVSSCSSLLRRMWGTRGRQLP